MYLLKVTGLMKSRIKIRTQNQDLNPNAVLSIAAASATARKVYKLF